MCRAVGKFTRVQAPKLDIFVLSVSLMEMSNKIESTLMLLIFFVLSTVS